MKNSKRLDNLTPKTGNKTKTQSPTTCIQIYWEFLCSALSREIKLGEEENTTIVHSTQNIKEFVQKILKNIQNNYQN